MLPNHFGPPMIMIIIILRSLSSPDCMESPTATDSCRPTAWSTGSPAFCLPAPRADEIRAHSKASIPAT